MDRKQLVDLAQSIITDEDFDIGFSFRELEEFAKAVIERSKKPCETGSQCIGGKCPECELKI